MVSHFSFVIVLYQTAGIMFPVIFIEPIASTITFPLVKYPIIKQPLPLSTYQERNNNAFYLLIGIAV